MDFAAKIDEFGRLPWILLMVLGFIVFWPIGLAMLFFLLWSGRMHSWRYDCGGRWYGDRDYSDHMERKYAKHMERMERKMGRMRDWWAERQARRPTGNRAFDEYREETLRRLEDEQKEFFEFLDRLRHAKDKAEFDQFMADRARRPSPPPQGSGPEPQPQV